MMRMELITVEHGRTICPVEGESCNFYYATPLPGLVLCLTEIADLMNHQLFEHHLKVAYLAFRLGEALGLSEQSLTNLLLGGLLHDIGAFSQRERLEALHFEFYNPHYHAFVAFTLLRDFEPFASLAEIIRFHHVPWEEDQGKTIPLESHVIHFADRVSIVCPFREDPLGEIREKAPFLRSYVPRLFHPEVFEAFQKILPRDYIWFDLASVRLRNIVSNLISPEKLHLDTQTFLSFCRIVAHLIDFRSAFTATHSSGVAHVARRLGETMGLSPERNDLLLAAGLLHDLGKLAIPLEILEKPGQLTTKEWHVMKSHVYYTFEALSWIWGLGDMARWASEHHERCNGQGYPFGKTGEELPLESRIMAVADVLVALSEDRPYRSKLGPHRVLEILESMAASGSLDADVVTSLSAHFHDIHASCTEVQQRAALEYAAFRQEVIQFAE